MMNLRVHFARGSQTVVVAVALPSRFQLPQSAPAPERRNVKLRARKARPVSAKSLTQSPRAIHSEWRRRLPESNQSRGGGTLRNPPGVPCSVRAQARALRLPRRSLIRLHQGARKESDCHRQTWSHYPVTIHPALSQETVAADRPRCCYLVSSDVISVPSKERFPSWLLALQDFAKGVSNLIFTLQSRFLSSLVNFPLSATVRCRLRAVARPRKMPVRFPV